MRFDVLSMSLVLALGACETPVEYVVLIEVESQIDLETLEVVAAPDGHAAVRTETFLTVTAADLAAAPARIVLQLAAPGPVRLRILGRARDGTSATALRCYDVRETPTEDRVLLVSGLADDVDGDGWPLDPMSACVAPGPVPCSAFACAASVADCNDADPDENPGGIDLCGIDRSCDGAPGPCVDRDMDGASECPIGAADPTCDCDDADPLVSPAADDVCSDGVDQDCNGSDLRCDRDMDGADDVVDCDDTDPDRYPDALEVCTELGQVPKDENCNGVVDELADCGPDDRDGDGYTACGVGDPPCDCDDCNAGVSPARTEICGDGIDQDCSGDDQACGANDADGDGVGAMASGGTDCDDDNPLVHPMAIENCMTRESESCGTAADDCSADLDGDGWLEPMECERVGVAMAPDQPEVCDGIDNDCDGVVDEVDGSGMGCVLDDTRTMATGVVYSGDVGNCGGCGVRCDVLIGADVCADGACGCSTSDSGDLGPPCVGNEHCCTEGRMAGCRDLSDTFEACGNCDVGCDSDFADRCAGGRCECGEDPQCTLPNECCGVGSGDHACRNLDNDESHCGGCGVRCGWSETCVGGRCTCADSVGDVGDGAVCDPDEVCCTSGCKKHRC